MPGFIDAHIHYPQTQVIGSYGAQLLDWLHNYTFVEEQKFADPAHCARVADFFLDELFRSGTTTAMVYCTVHPSSVDAFFAAAEERGARMIAGKVMMDRDAPEALMDTAQRGYDESKALIERWRGRGRLDYAITPRFAVTSTQAQLEAAGALAREFPHCYVQTHANENKAEIARVAALFPEAQSYIDVYARAGLLGPRSVFGHCIHLQESEVAALAESRSVAAFCPTSNLFLGSGLFDQARLSAGGGADRARDRRRRGHELFDAAHGRRRLQGAAAQRPVVAGARGLLPDDARQRPGAQPRRPHRLDRSRQGGRSHRARSARDAGARAPDGDGGGDLEVELFALLTLGDDRAVRQTYVAGEPRKGRGSV